MHKSSKTPTAVIIGGGPAGLTAAYELLKHTDIVPIVLEKDDILGGIARTVNYKGNRIDIGGHRFFSKSDKVMDWWLMHMPIDENARKEGLVLTYQNQQTKVDLSQKKSEKAQSAEEVMLVRNRKSRIYFLRRFFNYPIQLNVDTIKGLGIYRMFKIGMSYTSQMLFPKKKVKNLEDFFISRFGKQLYLTFFKDYTEKVWGVACKDISAEWGKQRIKGLSVSKALLHFFKSMFPQKESNIRQKKVETSLIEQFLYPKYGPGQLWEKVAADVKQMGGQVILNAAVAKIHCNGQKVNGVSYQKADGTESTLATDYVFSTMPVKHLIRSLQTQVPTKVKQISEALVYRDFITVGLLLNDLKVKSDDPKHPLIKDNWIYIQEPDVKVGRLQIFNNWSPYMVESSDKVWVGLEYFCFQEDELWQMEKEELIELAKAELTKIDLIESKSVLDATVIKMPKTYPAYFGAYQDFDQIRAFTDRFENLFLVGRNGMHKYNNQDHSMLTAMQAVENIKNKVKDKSNIWDINTEQSYHESKQHEKQS